MKRCLFQETLLRIKHRIGETKRGKEITPNKTKGGQNYGFKNWVLMKLFSEQIVATRDTDTLMHHTGIKLWLSIQTSDHHRE